MPHNVPLIRRFTLPDGYVTNARVWGVAAPRVRAVFVHGIVSHGGWYVASCRHLAAAGCEVHFVERRGSGLNLAARGDVGHYRTWLTDLEAYLAQLPAGPKPVLLGISWGGKLAAAFVRYRPDLLAGFAMIGPGLFAYQQPGPARRGLARLAARTPLAGRCVTIPLEDPALFTESPRWQEYIRTDPFLLHKVTLRFTAEDLKLNHFVTEAPETLRLPGLLVLAGRDRICDNQRTRQFFERWGTTDRTLLEYPNAAHTLEFEPDPSQYFSDLTRWILRVSGV